MVGGEVGAQASPQRLAIWPDIAGFATRGFVPDDHEGTLSVAFDPAHFRGAGFDGVAPSGRVDGFSATIQNQDASRALPYSFAVLASNTARPARPERARVLVETGTLHTPIVGNHAAAHFVTVSLATPAAVLGPSAGFHVAIRIPSAIATSRLFVHASSSVFGSVGDNARPDTLAVAHALDHANGGALWLDARTLDLGVLTAAPLLSVGADIAPARRRGPNPCFGAGGLFPSRSRADGIAFRVCHGWAEDALCVILGTPLGFQPVGVTLGGIGGRVMLNGPLMPTAMLVAAMSSTGELVAVSPLAPHPFHLAFDTLQFQAIIVPVTAPPGMTNAVAVDDGG